MSALCWRPMGLALAASPTFAIMALLTGVLGGGLAEVLCSAAHASPMSGMVTMHLLMSAFHAAPWLSAQAPAGWSEGSAIGRRAKARYEERTQTQMSGTGT